MNEDAAKFYSRHLDKHKENWKLEKQSEDFKQLLQEFVSKVGEGKVLDAGCGPGHHTEYFSQQGLKATGIDASEKSIEYARKSKEGKFLTGDITDLNFEDDSFDGIWCNAAIFFLEPEQMRGALEEFKRVAKQEAVFYISFKVGDGKTQREKHGDSVNQYHLPLESIRNILEEQGFELDEENTSEVDDQVFASFFCRRR